MNYKLHLIEILEQCTSDMIEEIMELHPRGPYDNNLLRTTEDEALYILKKLKSYQEEGCTIQGEDISHLNIML